MGTYISKKMKIALITIWHERNYGAELQAYATIKLFQGLGHEIEMINIRLEDLYPLSIKRIVGNCLRLISPSEKHFRSFWNKYIPKTRRYRSLMELRENPPKADCYLVGSDQVWNPVLTKELTPAYFLDFGDENIKRFSFASSFGTAEWTQIQYTDKIRSWLSRFNFVTCRETSGVALLKDVFNINSHVVVDPTLLLADYSEIVSHKTKKNTLVYYPLNEDYELEYYSKNLALKLGLQPINNKESSYLFSKIEWKRVSIEKWVENIATSSFVITRSFHGMVFCLIYHKQFVVLAGKNGRGTRLKSLLSLVGLEHRYFESIDDLDSNKPWEEQIDYDIVEDKIIKLRSNSMIILQKMLEV